MKSPTEAIAPAHGGRTVMPVVLDFDGVIADSGEVVLEVLNLIARERRQAPLTREALAAIEPQALRRAWRLRFYEVPALLVRARAAILARWSRLQLHADIVAPLHAVAARGAPLAIVSSNSEQVLTSFCARHLPDIAFAALVGDVGLWRKHHALARLMRRQRWAPARALYLGDEARDMVAARRAGCEGWGLTWGKDDAATLTAAGAKRTLSDGEALAAALAERLGPPL